MRRSRTVRLPKLGNPQDPYERGVLDGYGAGAAVAFGLMGMATAITSRPNLEACPLCGKASEGRVSNIDTPFRWMCWDCMRKGEK